MRLCSGDRAYITRHPHGNKLDNEAKLWAYLDDWYIWIKPQHITEAVELISTATRTINLELQPTKMQI